MRRRATRQTDASMSLFPFLAVLICTVGALIVLLVVVVQQAHVHGTVASSKQLADEAAVREARQVRQRQREEYERQIQQLRQSVDGRNQLRAENTNKLRQLQQHAHQLRARGQQLNEASAEHRQQNLSQQQSLASSEESVDVLRLRIEEARSRIDQSQRATESRQPSFALVPYDGPTGTQRRPIYIECLEDRVVLQPEGIAFFEEDFRGPLLSDNPLAAALRATQQYLVQSGTMWAGDRPYPLLLVRPGGAESYAASRAAMRHWDAEFGYELVPTDMQLAYPPADPALAQLLQNELEKIRGRRRTQLLAADLGGQQSQGPRLEASPYRGGFVRAEGSDTQSPRGFGGTRNRGGGQPERGRTRRQFPSPAVPPSVPGQPMRRSSTELATQSPGGAAQATGSPTAAAASRSPEGAAHSPLSQSRGRNWALPNGSDGVMGIARPVTITCKFDRFILPAESGVRGKELAIPITDSTLSAIEPLVAALWKRVESWGIAGPGVYWKPELHVRVTPGAEPRFQQLRALMADSGIQITRKL